jgi:hypothetical protein
MDQQGSPGWIAIVLMIIIIGSESNDSDASMV